MSNILYKLKKIESSAFNTTTNNFNLVQNELFFDITTNEFCIYRNGVISPLSISTDGEYRAHDREIQNIEFLLTEMGSELFIAEHTPTPGVIRELAFLQKSEQLLRDIEVGYYNIADYEEWIPTSILFDTVGENVNDKLTIPKSDMTEIHDFEDMATAIKIPFTAGDYTYVRIKSSKNMDPLMVYTKAIGMGTISPIEMETQNSDEDYNPTPIMKKIKIGSFYYYYLKIYNYKL